MAEHLATVARRERRFGDLALALRAQAWAERSTFAEDRAKRLLDEATRIARRHGETSVLVQVLVSRAAVQQELGRMAAAQRDLDAAAPLATGDQSLELQFQQAVLHQNLGRLPEAAGAYRRILLSDAASVRLRVISANNVAIILCQQGRHARALRHLVEIRERSRLAGPAVAALVAQTTAWVTVQAGRLPEGMRLFDEAAQAYALSGLPLAEHYVEYVDALMDLRLLPEARDVARRAADQLDAAPLMRAEAWLRVAQLGVLSGEPAAAADAATRAAESFRRQRRSGWNERARMTRIQALMDAGTATRDDLQEIQAVGRRMERLGMTAPAVEAYLAAGRLAAALDGPGAGRTSWDKAAQLSRAAPVLVRLKGRVAAALAARDRGATADCRSHCSRGLADLSRHRSAMASMELRALASGHGVELGRIGLEASLHSGPSNRTLLWMERTRAAALLTVEPPPPSEFQDDLSELRAVDAWTSQVRAGGPADGGRNSTNHDLEDRIRRAAWRQAAGTRGDLAPVGISELRRALDGRALVEYGRIGQDLLAVVVEPRRCRTVRMGSLDTIRSVLDSVFFGLRRLTQKRPEASVAAARLSVQANLQRLRRLLLDPVGVDDAGDLVVVPIGPLHGVPWSALHGGPVSLAPSATFWARTRLPREPATRGVLVAAGPQLPGAVDEARAVGMRYPGATVLAPPESTVNAVVSHLGQAGLAHLACHGRLRSDNPMFSALMLSDGLLTVQELDSRGVAPHRVVLAACESGASVSFPGEEVIGFVGALMARGSVGIIASTAAVPDVSTASLMPAVHERVAEGDTFAQALHWARKGLDSGDAADLVTWCAFNAYGAA